LRIGLKWPNDLYLRDPSTGGRKLGGVLIETLSAGAGRLVVIGIGLNLRRLVAGSDIPAGTAALDEIDPDATAPAVLERLVTPLGTALRRYEQNGFAAFKARFAARDLLAGRAVTSTQAGAGEGVAEGVDADGSLRVRLAGGMRVGISSGEVSVRLDRKALPC
jgi:BirA family biotin operon repressor/biotin-[acetyl-CoA-carboxylase] ligase